MEINDGAVKLGTQFSELSIDKNVQSKTGAAVTSREGVIWQGATGKEELNSAQVQPNYISELKESIRKYPKEQIPADIAVILGKLTPSVADASLLDRYIEARDTLVVWEELARTAQLEFIPVSWDSSASIIQQAEKFSDWFDQNKTVLLKLESLHLGLSRLIKLPKKIGQLTALKELNLHDNQLKEIGAWIGNLHLLGSLSVTNNRLQNVPVEIGNLQALQKLYISNNKLESFPQVICNLLSLKVLNIGNDDYRDHLDDPVFTNTNEFAELPSAIGNLVSLEELHLKNIGLTKIPIEFGKLVSLKNLDLEGNFLRRLPPECANLVSLEHLNLRENKLRELIDGIGNLNELKMLNLRDNELRALPESIGKLSNLHRLVLTGNFKEFPKEIIPLTQSLGELWIEHPIPSGTKVKCYVVDS